MLRPPHLALSPAPLVGREREMATLWHTLKGGAAGRSAVTVVCSDPGIGKTRLLDGLADHVVSESAPVRCGNASDPVRMPTPRLEPLGDAHGLYMGTTGAGTR